jgi:4-amino-4-deoxy-L-arabinose transferase-like glycosyltransferase
MARPLPNSTSSGAEGDRYRWWPLVGVLAVAAAMRAHGIGWGLPDVLEEATPLRIAWNMRQWLTGEAPDLNPHFFNYPTLAIYLQLGANFVLYGLFHLLGRVQDGADFLVRYVADPTPIFLTGRLVSAALGLATVAALYRLGRRSEGAVAGILAAALLAIDLYHVGRSKMIEVDVPLTCFVTLALVFMVRMLTDARARVYALAGLAVGLAASSKYNGALLLVPLVVAHFLGRREASRASHALLVLAAAVAGVAFALTSPYVFLDFESFRTALATESQHMRAGHFGMAGGASAGYYLHALGARVVGWPALAAALAGFVYFAFVRRRAWAIVTGSFLVIYFATIATWQMKAARYVLPLVPVLLLFASAALVTFADRVAARWPRRAVRQWVLAVGVAALAISVLAWLPEHRRRLEKDSRTACREWITSNAPAGTFFASEAYGPWLVAPLQYVTFPQEVKRRVEAAAGKTYAMLSIPMFQVEAERSEVFYDLALYGECDAVIVTDAVSGRYVSDRVRFLRQAAFYDSLAAQWRLVATFAAAGAGPEISVYANPAHARPFSERAQVSQPPRLRRGREQPSGGEGRFLYEMGTNHEAFQHYESAFACYRRALGQPYYLEPQIYRRALVGGVSCLMTLGRRDDALRFAERARELAPSPAEARYAERLRARIPTTNGGQR